MADMRPVRLPIYCAVAVAAAVFLASGSQILTSLGTTVGLAIGMEWHVRRTAHRSFFGTLWRNR